MSTSTFRKLRGFTLVELLITLTVLVITLAIAAPAMSGFVRSSQLSGTQTELIGALMLARSEARPRHPKASDPDDPWHAARSREVTALWRLAVRTKDS